MEGVINVYKEAGWSSGDVVNKLKGVLHQRRIGHGGTLDPDATGVLPICVGRATRLFDYITAFKKTYVACVRFGIVTDTQDASGTVTATNPVNITQKDIDDALPKFLGKIMQIPPMYSALHVNGKRLYDIARSGETVQLSPREVSVEAITVVKPLAENECTLKITCGKGTYIRTLCHDLGTALGCGAHMKSLMRTSAAGLDIENAFTVSELQKMMEQGDTSFLQPTETAVGFMPRVNIDLSLIKRLENGNPVSVTAGDKDIAGFVRLYCGNVFFGIGTQKEGYYYLKCMLGGTE